MFAIAFDLVVSATKQNNPKLISQSYAEIGLVLKRYGFERVQGSLYVTQNQDMSMVTRAMVALKKLPWFPDSVRDIRAFRVENWSDYTEFIKID